MADSRLVEARRLGDGTYVKRSESGAWVPITPRVNLKRLKRTTEAEIARHIREDDAEAAADAVKRIKAIRKSTGLTKSAFAERIGVPVETVQSWETAQSWPEGPARKLLRALERAPKTVMKALAD